MESNLLPFIYLLSSVTFIWGLKMLSNPKTARRGNLFAALGMSIAIIGTIFLYQYEGKKLGNLLWIFVAIAIGSLIGWLSAVKVKMTAMPEMVSLFNGMGGACAMLIGIVEFDHLVTIKSSMGLVMGKDLSVAKLAYSNQAITSTLLIVMLGLIIGAISFAGSIIAWGKLNGRLKDYSFKGQHIFNIAILITIFGMAAYIIGWQPKEAHILFYVILTLALVYGVVFVFPIGGADMPVVISLLNSFTGVAAACGGFLYGNKVMLTGGILVGAAGTLLTILMCKAMNRSLVNVLIGSFGGGGSTGTASTGTQGTYKQINLSDTAVLLSYASKVYIVPGYGLAVAQAQHICHDMEKILADKGVDVKYAIHPVAGRMPGHMNVLLAEADVAYDSLQEMEQANAEFANTDVVMVLGANDVVNPAAKTDKQSPIYGMPILDVSLAKHVIVNKRSMKPGYAGIENELFFQPKTSMLFGDAKKVLQDLVAEIKSID